MVITKELIMREIKRQKELVLIGAKSDDDDHKLLIKRLENVLKRTIN